MQVDRKSKEETLSQAFRNSHVINSNISMKEESNETESHHSLAEHLL